MVQVGIGFFSAAILVGQAIPDQSWLERGGIIGLLGFILLSFMRGWIHTDKEFRERELTLEKRVDALGEELDFYRESWQKQMQLAQSATAVAKELAPQGIEDLARVVDEARKRGQIP